MSKCTNGFASSHSCHFITHLINIWQTTLTVLFKTFILFVCMFLGNVCLESVSFLVTIKNSKYLFTSISETFSAGAVLVNKNITSGGRLRLKKHSRHLEQKCIQRAVSQSIIKQVFTIKCLVALPPGFSMPMKSFYINIAIFEVFVQFSTTLKRVL